MFMAESRNNIRSEEAADAPVRRGLDVGAAVPSRIAKFLRGVRRYVTGALIAASPALGSCVNIDSAAETEVLAQGGNEGVDQTTESANVADRTVNLWFDGKNWHFEGKYPKNFQLTVEVDGKQVFDEPIHPAGGSFNLYGVAGETARDIQIKAYDPEAQDMQTYQIPIEPKKSTKGMYGVPNLHNVEYPAN